MLYNLLRFFFWIGFRILFWLLGGLRIEGANNVPKRGAVLITPNHVSFADPPLIGATMRRGAWFVATDEMFAIPVLGRIARMLHAYPIRQDSPDRAALRKTQELLKRGEAVVIFPEGHVSKTAAMQPIQPGFMLLVQMTGAPVVPVGIVGTDKMMPPHQWKLHRARQRTVVRYGEPISAEELTGGLKGRAGVEHGVRVLTEAIARLSDQPIPAIEEPAPSRKVAEKQPAEAQAV
jgi:1-acyl-sn-glycerol-3-phosphate acyltransferase